MGRRGPHSQRLCLRTNFDRKKSVKSVFVLCVSCDRLGMKISNCHPPRANFYSFGRRKHGDDFPNSNEPRKKKKNSEPPCKHQNSKRARRNPYSTTTVATLTRNNPNLPKTNIPNHPKTYPNRNNPKLTTRKKIPKNPFFRRNNNSNNFSWRFGLAARASRFQGQRRVDVSGAIKFYGPGADARTHDAVIQPRR